MNYDLKPPGRSLCDKLAEDLGSPASYFPIEKICRILREEYSPEDMEILEAEFILEYILKYHPEIDPDKMDSLMVEKLYAIPALFRKFMLVSESLLAFHNTVRLCNDVPAGITEEEDIVDLPSRFIHRTLLSLDAMLPDDITFNDMYFYPNVKRYIFDMYSRDDSIILPPVLAYLQEQYLESTFTLSQAEEFRTMLKAVKPELEELENILASAVANKNNYSVEESSVPLYSNEEDLSLLQIRMHTKGYYSKEAALLRKYPEDTFTGRCVRNYLRDVIYGYVYPYLNTGMSNRRMLLAIDVDSYNTEDSMNRLAAEIDAVINNLSLMDTTRVFLYSSGMSDSDAIKLKDLLTEDTDVELIRAVYRQDRLEHISEDMFDRFGPPSRLVIMSKGKVKDPLTGFYADYRKRVRKGWYVSVIG